MNKEKFNNNMAALSFNLVTQNYIINKNPNLLHSKFDIYSDFYNNYDFSYYLTDLFLDNLSMSNPSLSDSKDLSFYNDEEFLDAYKLQNNKSNVSYNTDPINLNNLITRNVFLNLDITTLLKRRSIRTFANKTLSLKMLANILYYSFHRKNMWDNHDFNHYASAGGLYPVDVYLYINNVSELKKGVYAYDNLKNSLYLVNENTIDCFENIDNFKNFNNFNFLIFFVWNTTFNWFKYHNNALLFSCIEAGEMSQNLDLLLNATEFGMCLLGGFNRPYMEFKVLGNSAFSRIINIGVVGCKNEN